MTRKHLAGLSDSIDDGDRPLSTPFTTLLSTNTVLSFLDKSIPEDTDLIISTVRKGSWIIEDYLRRTGRHIRNITSNEPFPKEFEDAKILLFDDSVHTGRTVLDLYRNIPRTNNKTNSHETYTTVCCIAINEDAVKKLNAGGIENIRYLKLFKNYDEYRMEGTKEKELTPGCQSYYYSHFIVPYISGLTFNYSPDYRSLSIRIRTDTSANLNGVITTVFDAIRPLITDTTILYQNTTTLRETAELNPSFTAEILKGFCTAPFEPDMGKLRVSAIAYSGCIEIVVTPIVSYRVDTDADLRHLLFRCSDEIISATEDKIADALERDGYTITGRNRFQANEGIRWEQ